MSARLVAAVALAASLFGSRVSFAKDAAMILDFEGKQQRALHDRVVRAVKKAGVSVTAVTGASPKDDSERKAVAKKRGVAVFVEGTVTVSKKGIWTLQLTSHGGRSGGEGELSLEGRSVAALFKKVDSEVPGFVKDQLVSTKADEPEAKKDEPELEAKRDEPEAKKDESEAKKDEPGAKKDESEASDDDAPGKKNGASAARPSPLSLGLGMRVFSRNVSYNQDVNQNLRPYQLDAAPSGFVTLGWYPGAHFTSGVAANVGIVGDFEQSVGASSVLDASGAKYSTSMRAFSVGVRGRLPLDTDELGLSVRYGSHAFTIDGDADPSALSAAGLSVQRDLVPDVRYSYLQPALDVRFAFGAFGIGGHVGYRLVLSAGAVQDAVWFPNAKVGGLHTGLFVSYELAASFHALLGVDVRRYGLSMRSAPSDLGQGRDVAGGAIDQYLAAFLGVEYRLPGDSAARP